MKIVNWIFNILLCLFVASFILASLDWLFQIRIAGGGVTNAVRFLILIPPFFIALIAKVIVSQRSKEAKTESLFK